MNDLIRPALYQSHHEILPVVEEQRQAILADVVGPVCETGDFLARDREMADVAPGDLLAVATAGAYGFVLSSNYNSRPRVAEGVGGRLGLAHHSRARDVPRPHSRRTRLASR
ncbi:MAG: hypothetical protein R2724_01050 [Bryobacterales bacterium]